MVCDLVEIFYYSDLCILFSQLSAFFFSGSNINSFKIFKMLEVIKLLYKYMIT